MTQRRVMLLVFHAIAIPVAFSVWLAWSQPSPLPPLPPMPPPLPAPHIPHLDPPLAGGTDAPPVDPANSGYTPDPEGTRRFLRTLSRPLLLQANPMLQIREGEPVLLYRALAKTYKQFYGKEWVVGRQGIGDCFVEGTMVAMADGTERRIEDVRIGDYVLSHTGVPRRVCDTFVKKFTGELVTIRAKGWDVPVTATADHRFVHYPGIRFGKGSGNYKPDTTPQWKPIGQLNVGDRVLLSKPAIPSSQQTIALRDGREVECGEELGYLIGLYLAEGGLDKYPNGLANRVTLSLGRHEPQLISRASGLFEAIFGVRGDVDLPPSKPSVALVRCGNVTVAQAFQELIPGGIYTKCVPGKVLCSPREVRMATIKGWMDGDGHTALHVAGMGHSFQVQGTSASIPLLQSSHRLALSCNLKPMLRMRSARQNRAPSGDIFLYGENALAIRPEMRHQVVSAMNVRGLRKTDRSVVAHGIAAPIEKMTREYVTDHDVYCISVEDEHSFIANGYGVHNCVSWGWAHAADTHLAVMYQLGDTGEWRSAATEAIYGGSRVEARGKTSAGYSDGSYGGAAAKWVSEWGIVFRQKYTAPWGELDLTSYSSSRAKEWGNYGCGGAEDVRANSWFDQQAKSHPIKQVALVRTFKEAAAAIQSGYPVAVCSGQGFASKRDKDGFAQASGSWAHCMCFISVRFDRPGLLCLNSWGPGWISGPKWPDDQPEGSFWVEADVADRMLSGGDSFAVSGYQGFPYRELKHSDWVRLAPVPRLEVSPLDASYALAP